MSRILMLLILIVGLLGVGASLRRSDDGAPAPCLDDECVEDATREVGAALGPPSMTWSEACSDAGYLCLDVQRSDSMRILRWPDQTSTLTVYIPVPDNEAPPEAQRMQRAAVRGVLAWTGRPFPIRVVERPSQAAEADIKLSWAHGLPDRRLGQVRFSLRIQGERTEFSVQDFTLVTRHPVERQRLLREREVELAAAHEMGHALGLPHSDQQRDVMYPENTASHLSARDYRTLEAVYRIPVGTLIVQ